jgi:hypothetical protein
VGHLVSRGIDTARAASTPHRIAQRTALPRRRKRARGRDAEPEPALEQAQSLQRATFASVSITPGNSAIRSMTESLFRSKVENGILGDFAISATGDTTANAVTIYRITNGQRRLFP